MSISLLTSWQSACIGVGMAAPPVLLKRLRDAYTEPQRHYHTLQHLGECLDLLATVRHLAQHPAEVEMALWFHDAVYDVRATDNEARSAAWATSALHERSIDPDCIRRIAYLIMATRHDARHIGVDACLMTDIDLAILGAEPARFDEYQLQIGREYTWVPRWLFRKRRQQLLRRFLDRPRIYQNDALRDRFETRARDNLRRALEH